jgi:hypothetical protein
MDPHRLSCAILIAAAFAVACSTTTANQDDSGEASSENQPLTEVSPGPTPDEVDEQTDAPVRLDMSGESAEWFVENANERQRYTTEDDVVGESCAMHVHFEGRKSVLVYCLGDDLPHIVRAVPGTRMLRFGRDDALLAFTDDRRLLRWNPGREKWMVRNRELPSSRFTDATGRYAVVASESGAWVSTDEGKSFDPLPSIDHTITGALIRPDGLVVLQANADDGHIALTAQEPYARWTEIDGASRPLARRGAWVKRFAANWALAVDGQTWVSPDYPDHERWGDFLATSTTGRPVAHAGVPRWTTQKPPAPSLEDDDEGGGGQGFGRIGGLGKCSGIGCLDRYPNVPPSHIVYSLVGQFMCDKDAEQGPHDRCVPSAEIVYVPGQTVRDKSVGEFFALENAEPWMARATLHSHGGLGIAAEKLGEDRTAYWVADRSLDWKKEMTLEGSKFMFRHVGVASDGTILLRSKDHEQVRAWVRPPAKPGGASNWTDVTVDDAVFYRPLPGGEALVMIDKTDGGYESAPVVVGFVRVHGDGSKSVIIDDVELVDFKGKVILIDDHGRLILTADPYGKFDDDEAKIVPRMLYDDGSWREVSPNAPQN